MSLNKELEAVGTYFKEVYHKWLGLTQFTHENGNVMNQPRHLVFQNIIEAKER
jgi:hypothetical protein